MRAVEKFDYGCGNKFSTCASWAIVKNFALGSSAGA
jgi:RNA polymerase primary sigma factor/RNA polymerase sigma factor